MLILLIIIHPRLDKDDGGDGGRILPEQPSPILHAPRDNISRKGKSLTPIKQFLVDLELENVPDGRHLTSETIEMMLSTESWRFQDEGIKTPVRPEVGQDGHHKSKCELYYSLALDIPSPAKQLITGLLPIGTF